MTAETVWITVGYRSGSCVRGEFDSEGPQHHLSRRVVLVDADRLAELLPFLETADDASVHQLRRLCRELVRVLK